MDEASNAMAAEIANDPETASLRSTFDSTADIAHRRTGPCLR